MRLLLASALLAALSIGPLAQTSQAGLFGKHRSSKKRVVRRTNTLSKASSKKSSSNWYRQRINPRDERQDWFSYYSY